MKFSRPFRFIFEDREHLASFIGEINTLEKWVICRDMTNGFYRLAAYRITYEGQEIIELRGDYRVNKWDAIEPLIGYSKEKSA